MDLLRDLHSIQQSERTLSIQFTDMKILWDELENLRPTLIGSCSVPCTCSLSSSVRSFKNMEYIIFFLKGLNGNYVNVRTQILLMDHLTSILKLYSLVPQQDSTASMNTNNLSSMWIRIILWIWIITCTIFIPPKVEEEVLEPLCFALTGIKLTTLWTIVISNMVFPRLST